MTFSYERRYRGRIRAALLDWAGTTLDHGCMAPAGVFVDMCLQNVINLQVSPVAACVKVDDTVLGVEEGLNAGMWTVGLALSGNEIGLPLSELEALDPAERDRRRQRAYARLHQAGAHFVVDSIAEIVPCLDDIEARLARGERP
jgi:phosphonoacetaldehyde hydrolase